VSLLDGWTIDGNGGGVIVQRGYAEGVETWSDDALGDLRVLCGEPFPVKASAIFNAGRYSIRRQGS